MRVLMVCLGNICRSPIAEAWLQKKSEEQGFEIQIDSAGTSGLHSGEKADYRMRNFALEYGVNMDHLRSRQFSVTDFDQFDRIFVMDHSNLKNIHDLARNEEDKLKVSLYLNELEPQKNLEVPDPYYGGEKEFKFVIELMEKTANAFITNQKTK